MKTLVGITYNRKYNVGDAPPDAKAERDNNTILSIRNALVEGGYDVELFEVTAELPYELASRRPDIVFNSAEGMSGRVKEVQVPAILTYLGIPFTGSEETAAHIAMDKALAKGLVGAYRIRTPKYNIVQKDMFISENDIPFPVIVKPVAEGSGRGISEHSIVYNSEDLRMVLTENINEYSHNMLIEEYIPGREFTVGILGNAEDMRVFPPMEVVFNDKANTLYSYEVKKDFSRYVRYECPPDISEDIRGELERTAGGIFRILGCRDYARIDFRLSRDELLYFLEVNPQPGLAQGYSDFPMIGEFCGVGYNALILGILEAALKRYGMI